MRLSCWQGFFFFPEDYKEESASESPLDFGGLLANKKNFYWTTVALQRCVVFCSTPQ